MEFADPFTVTLACIFTLVCILYIVNRKNVNKYQNFPPGPRPLPLIGNLHLLNLKNPQLTMLELSKKYGPVFSFQMGMKKTVVLAGYETVKEALVTHAEEFGDRARLPIFQDMDQGHGLVLANGETWKVMRRFAISTLRDFGMGKSTIEDKIIEECGSLVQRFESFRGQPFESSMIMNAAVANIIVAVLLGKRYDYEDAIFHRLFTLISDNIKLIGSPIVSLYNMYPFIGFLPGNHKTVLKNIDEFFSFIKNEFVTSVKQLDKDDKRSLIEAFLIKEKEEESNPHTHFHTKNLLTIVRSLFGAGMETTATTLLWGLLYMMKYPAVQKKVQEEIDIVLGSAQVQFEHRKKMPYTNAVIHEIQRFANILPMSLPHETATDVNFLGYFIPKGTLVTPLLASVLKDKACFEKPEEFYPQNFLDSKGGFVMNEAFMPFSTGRRVCAGETLAKMELFLFFTTLLQKFNFHLPPGVTEVDLTPVVGLVVLPKHQMFCAVARL